MATIKTYLAHTKNDEFRKTFEARSHEDAADLAVRSMLKTKVGAFRTTGDPGKSGWFQGYVKAGQNQSRSYGNPIHVAEV